MGLFSSKKKKTDADVVTESEGNATKKSGRKKKKTGMATVFKETVFEAVLDDFVANQSFALELYGNSVYVGMLLDTNTVGGFSKKSNRDEAKGSIIECINAGSIKTLMTQELIDEECMIIIPDENTLYAMDEFSLLTDAEYTVAYIHDDGTIEKTDIAISYEDAKNISAKAITIQEFLGVENESDEDESDDEIENENEEVTFDESEDNDYDDADEAGENETGDEPPADFDPYQFDEADVDENMSDDEGTNEQDFDDYEAEPEPEPLDLIPDEDVIRTIKRKFYSDDLRLEVSTEPFDAQFVHENPYVAFDENRGDGWLNNYLNQMSHNANVELKRMHQENLLNARRKYCRLMEMYCDKITKDLDTSDTESRFGGILQTLKQSKQDALDDMDRVIFDTKTELEDKWKETLEQVGEDAKVQAQHQYRERYGRQHEQDIINVDTDIKYRIESDYNEALNHMNDDRRKEASKMLDIGVNNTLNAVSNIYLGMLKQENARYEQIKADMAAFIDDNRKNDMAYEKTMAEQLRQTQMADKVRDELTSKIQNMNAEFNAKELSLRAELENMQHKHDESLRDKEEACNSKLKEAKAQNAELQKQLDEIMKSYVNVKEETRNEYQSRINELSNERTSWEEKCNHVIAANARANKISVLLVVVAIVASLSIGIIIGTSNKMSDTKAERQSAVMEEFNQRADELENEARQQAKEDAESEYQYDDTQTNNTQSSVPNTSAGASAGAGAMNAIDGSVTSDGTTQTDNADVNIVPAE